ncbi:hypothetical protein J5N97_017086 [Dioscorea zingiberensis]|uniref:CCHC-type domain-containing protein n=1 Tax=Dioscorea zingiberensis TaxID=325984 RepID=A0A9D5HFT5_9LILI|nr:hypothetical protein J5N97_017086 [Dioscorea zingiberensis]
MELGGLLRRSPPTLNTLEGPIQVCGQCLCPGHRADECLSDITCRRCGGVGHKAAKCREARRDLGKLYGALAARGARQKEPRRPIERKENRPWLRHDLGPPEKMGAASKTRDISLPLDDEMMNDKELMKKYTIATVKTLNGGMPVDRNSLAAGLQEALGDHWEWASRPFRNGRFLVACPSPEEAQGLEDVPCFCWHRNTIAKLVEPVGELIFADERGSEYVDDVRAAIRVRQGEELPLTISASIGTRKHVITVEMERGQAELPWSKAEKTTGDVAPAQPGRTPRQGEGVLDIRGRKRNG